MRKTREYSFQKKQSKAIYALHPEELPDIPKSDNSDNSYFDSVEVLDAPTVKIEVFSTDGRILENARIADMGALTSGKIGYDSNAWFWEGGNAVKIIDKISIYKPLRFAGIIRDILRYI